MREPTIHGGTGKINRTADVAHSIGIAKPGKIAAKGKEGSNLRPIAFSRLWVTKCLYDYQLDMKGEIIDLRQPQSPSLGLALHLIRRT